jgi:hypothetical protein
MLPRVHPHAVTAAALVLALALGASPAFAQIEPPPNPCDLPQPPNGFEYDLERDVLVLSWNNPGECVVPQYDLEIGTTPGGKEITDGLGLPNGFRFPSPRVLPRMSIRLRAPETGEWYVRLYAVIGGGFVPEKESAPSTELHIVFNNLPPPNPTPCLVIPQNLRAATSPLGTEFGFPVTFTWSTGGTPGGCPPVRYRLVAGLAPGEARWTFDLGFPARPLTLYAPPGRYFVRIVAVNSGGFFGGEDARASNEVFVELRGQ